MRREGKGKIDWNLAIAAAFLTAALFIWRYYQ